MNDTHNIHLCFRFDKNEFSQFFARAKTTKTANPNRTFKHIAPNKKPNMRFRPILKPYNTYDITTTDSYLLFFDDYLLGANVFTVHDDMKLQIIQLLGAYVPDDFDWDDHIGLFVY